MTERLAASTPADTPLPADPGGSDTTAGIEVRHSPIHGLGVFARQPLPAGTGIGRYEGRRYTPDEVNQRGWDTALTYVFGLSDGSLIDAAEGGNATRHINHACEPNCIAWEVEDDEGRPVVEIETLRDLQAGEELLLDYALDVGDEDPARFACRCGCRCCRGTMLGTPAAA